MWGSTGIMASAIASGLEDEGVPVRIIDIQKNHHSDVMTELADCGAVIVGSATHNNNVLPGIADVLTYMKGLRPLNRVGAAFGSYGWSGESPKIIQEWLASMNMDMPADPVKCLKACPSASRSARPLPRPSRRSADVPGVSLRAFPRLPVPAAKAMRGASRGSLRE